LQRSSASAWTPARQTTYTSPCCRDTARVHASVHARRMEGSPAVCRGQSSRGNARLPAPRRSRRRMSGAIPRPLRPRHRSRQQLLGRRSSRRRRSSCGKGSSGRRRAIPSQLFRRPLNRPAYNRRRPRAFPCRHSPRWPTSPGRHPEPCLDCLLIIAPRWAGRFRPSSRAHRVGSNGPRYRQPRSCRLRRARRQRGQRAACRRRATPKLTGRLGSERRRVRGAVEAKASGAPARCSRASTMARREAIAVDRHRVVGLSR
jgi:hypothetical protein